MTSISELIVILEEIKKKHGDIPVRKLEYGKDEYEFLTYYEDVKNVKFTTDQNDDDCYYKPNPYADGFVVIEQE